MSWLARAVGAFAVLSVAPLVARAGWITPGQVPGGIDPARITMYWAQGAELPPNGAFTTEYAASGLVLDRAAVVPSIFDLGWAPVGTRFIPPWFTDHLANHINYSRGYNGVISGSFVVPGTDQPAQLRVLRVAYEGLQPDEIGLLAIYGEMGWINIAPRVIHPPNAPGEVVLEIESPVGFIGFTGFETYRYLSLDPDAFYDPWRVVGVEFELMAGPSGSVATPEPATGILALLGLGGVAWRVRRGVRRATS